MWEIKQATYMEELDCTPWYISRSWTDHEDSYCHYLHSDGVARPSTLHNNEYSGYYKTKEEAEAVLAQGECPYYFQTDVDCYSPDGEEYGLILTVNEVGKTPILQGLKGNSPVFYINFLELMVWAERHKEKISNKLAERARYLKGYVVQ